MTEYQLYAKSFFSSSIKYDNDVGLVEFRDRPGQSGKRMSSETIEATVTEAKWLRKRLEKSEQWEVFPSLYSKHGFRASRLMPAPNVLDRALDLVGMMKQISSDFALDIARSESTLVYVKNTGGVVAMYAYNRVTRETSPGLRIALLAGTVWQIAESCHDQYNEWLGFIKKMMVKKPDVKVKLPEGKTTRDVVNEWRERAKASA